MPEIELHKRYPHSRHEDVTDAFTRGAIHGMEYMQAENDRLIAENDKLRELVRDLWQYIYVGTAQDGQRLHDRTCDLGIEVK